MALETSSLTIKVQSDGIQSATEALNKLAAAGDKAEKSATKLSQSNKGAEASAKAQEKVWYDLIDKASKHYEKQFNIQQKALQRANSAAESAILKEAQMMNRTFDKRANDEKASYAKLSREADKYYAQRIKDAERAFAEENRLIARQAAIAEAAAKRAALQNARFTTSSVSSRLTTVQQAMAFGAAGGNIASQYGSSVAALANAQGVKQLTDEHKRLQDAANKSRSAINGSNKSMSDAHALARGLSGSLGALWLTYGNVTALAAGAAIGAGFKEIVSEGAKVEHVLQSIGVRSDESQESVQALRNQVLEIGKGVYGPLEVAKAFETLILAGQSAGEALKTVKDALNLATVGGTSIEKSAYTLVQVGTAMGYTAEGFSTVADVIAKTAAATMSNVESLSEAFKSASAVGKLYGVTLQDLATQLGALSQLGIQGSAAGTSVKNFYKELSSISPKAVNTLKSMGLSPSDFKDTSGRFLDLITVIQKLSGGLSTLREDQRQLAIQNLSNERGIKTAVELLDLYQQKVGQSGDKLQELRKQIGEAGGYASQGAARMALTAESQMKSVGNTLKSTFVEAFKEIEPQIVLVARALKDAFSSPEFKGSVQAISLAIADFGLAIVNNLPTIINFGKALLAFKVASVVAGAFTALTGTVTALGSAFSVMAAGTLSLSVVLPALGVVIAAAAGAWALYSLFKDKAFDESKANAAKAQSTDFVENLRKENDRISESNRLMKENIEGKKAMQMANNNLALQDLSNTHSRGIIDLELQRDKALAEISDDKTRRTLANPATMPEKSDIAQYQKIIDLQKRIGQAYKDKASAVTRAETEIRRSQQVGDENAKLQNDAQQKEYERQRKLAEGATGMLAVKPDKNATKQINFIQSEREELQKLIASYNAKSKAMEASFTTDYKVMAETQQAIVEVNRELGKYGSKSADNKVYQDMSALAKLADEAKLRDENNKKLTEFVDHLKQGIAGEEAFQQASEKEGASFFGTQRRKAEYFIQNMKLADDFSQKLREWADEEDRIGKMQDARNKLNTAADSARQRAGEAQAEIDAMEKFGAKTKVTAIEVAKLAIEKAKLSSKGDDLIKNNLLEAASLEQLKDGYRNLLKQGIDLNKELQDAQAEGVGVFAESEEAKIQIASNAAKKRAEIEYESIREAAALRISNGTSDGSEWEALFKGYDVMSKNIETNDQVSSQKLANVRLKDWKKSVDDIERIAREGFFNLTQSGTNIWSSMLTTFKSMFKTTVMEYIYKEFAKPIVLKLVADVSGSLGFSDLSSAANKLAGGDGSTSGSGDLVSKAVNAFGTFSKGLNNVSGKIAEGVQYGIDKSGLSMGTGTPGAFAQGVGNVATGYAAGSLLNSGISGKYETGSGFMTSQKIATAVASYFSPVAGAVVGAIGGLINRAFGRGPKETTSMGIRGSIGAGGVTGENYTNWKQDGGWFRSDKKGTDTATLTPDIINSFKSGLDGLKAASSSFAGNLGVSADALKDYSKTFDITLTKDAEANNQAIEKFFSDMGDDIATKLIPNIATFGRNGETAATTLERLSTTFKVTNDVAKLLGKTSEQVFGAAGLASEALRTKLVDLSGGADALSSKTSAYVDSIYTDAQKLEPVKKAVADAMASLGLAGVTTKEQFKNTVDGLDLTKESNIALFNSLLDLAPAFGTVIDAAKESSDKVKELADKVGQQQIALLEAQGRSYEALALSRQKELDAMDESLRAVQMQIYAAQDKAKTDDLLINLLEEQGLSSEALAKSREKELAALSATDQVIQQQIYSAQDKAKTEELQIKLLEAQNNAAGALAITRRNELKAMSATDAAIQKQIYDMEDAMSAVDTSFDRLTKSVNAQKDAVNKAADAAKEAAQTELDAAKTRKDAIEKVMSSLDKALDGTKIESESMNAARRAEAQAYLVTAAANVKSGGDITKLGGLDKALEDVANPSKNLYKTFEEYARDQAKTANVIEDLRNTAISQDDYAQLTIDRLDATIKAIDKQREADIEYLDGILDKAQEQIDALKGIDSSVQSLAQAIEGFKSATAGVTATAIQQSPGGGNTSAIGSLYQSILGRSPDAAGLAFWEQQAKNGISMSAIAEAIKNSQEKQDAITKASTNPGLPSFDVGTNDVPYDMVAQIHKGERIFPAADNAELKRRLNTSDSGEVSSSEVKQMLSEIKDVIVSGDVANVMTAKELLRLMKRWDLNGLPEERNIEMDA